MNRLPIGETIRFAYQFALNQLGTIIGLIWIPMVAIAILRFLPYGLGDNTLSPESNPTAAGSAALRGIVFALASILLYASINVAVVRQALGLRKGPAIAHFALGAPEFRMWGAMMLLFAIVVVMMLGFGLALAATIAVATLLHNPAIGGILALPVTIGGLCLLLVAIVRLGFLLVPVTVVENKISFERGWLLTQGNFWRISAAMFVVTLPLALVLLGSFVVLMGPQLAALAADMPKLTQQDFADKLQLIVDSHITTIIGINLIVAPFSVGLTLGASAFGYKVLSAKPAPVENPGIVV